FGPVQLEISAANYQPAKVPARIAAGKQDDLAVLLVPNPPLVKVHGVVRERTGKPLEAAIKFAGDQISEIRSDAAGAYATSLVAGSYHVRADVPGLPGKESDVELIEGGEPQMDFVLQPPRSDPTL